MDKVLIILRGLPGCGKSTVAEVIARTHASDPDECVSWWPIFTADAYFERSGKYEFDRTQLGVAHGYCQAKVENAMVSKEPRIIVANTNTTEKELLPYLKLAERYNYNVISLIVENRHGGKNVHDVPEETIEKMKERFEIQL